MIVFAVPAFRIGRSLWASPKKLVEITKREKVVAKINLFKIVFTFTSFESSWTPRRANPLKN
jgi:hypothetical protein